MDKYCNTGYAVSGFPCEHMYKFLKTFYFQSVNTKEMRIGQKITGIH